MASDHVRLTRLDRRPDGSYLLGFASPDRVAFAEAVAAIKAHIPYWGRRYEPDQRAWWVANEAYLWLLVDVLPELRNALHADASSGGRGSTYTRYREARHGCPPAEVAAAFAALHLLPSAPPELVSAARRILARIAHPDAGGEHRAMVRVNNDADVAERWATQQVRKAGAA